MKTKHNIWMFFTIFIIIFSSCKQHIPDNPILKDQKITISPDYSGITIPWNIAPLNFSIEKKADEYLTIVSSSAQNQKFIFKNKDVIFKIGSWQNFLQQNKGDTIFYDIYLK